MLNTSLRQHCLQRVRDNRVNGASEIAREALGLMAEYAREARAGSAAELRGELDRLVREMRALRPGMAPIDNLLARWHRQVAAGDTADLSALRETAVAAAEYWVGESLAAVDRIAMHAAALIADGSQLMTHSMSSTIGAVFRKLRGRNVRAIVTESDPGREGRLLAAQLSAMGVETQFITDAQMGVFAGQADLVLVGADSVLVDGSVLNKAGTYPLALVARDQDRPFYVCSESFKQRPLQPSQVQLEEDDARLIQAPDLPGVRPRNLPLDMTPACLISGWIDESGIALDGPPGIESEAV